MENIKKRLEEQEKRITRLEDFNKLFVAISCNCCKRMFHIFKEDFYKFKRQKLNIYCPFTRKMAVNWRDYDETND